MAAQILALYNPPADPAAFDAYYVETHLPIAKKIPGLTSYSVSTGPVVAGGGAEPPYHLVAQLNFASLEAVQAAFASPEGAATVADLANFAQAGVTVVFYELKEV